jgi:hypothetical protein
MYSDRLYFYNSHSLHHSFLNLTPHLLCLLAIALLNPILVHWVVLVDVRLGCVPKAESMASTASTSRAWSCT